MINTPEPKKKVMLIKTGKNLSWWYALISNFNKYGDYGDVNNDLKESWNGEINCSLKISNTHYGIACTGIYRNLHMKYYCEKDTVNIL